MTITPELHTPVPAPEPPRLRHRRKSLRPSDIATLVAAVVLLTVIAWTLTPGWFTSHDPLIGDGALKFLPPSAEHWFGTDRAGRDTFARVVHGTRNTVYGAVIGTSIGLVVGTVLGVAAGVLRGAVDAVIMRVVDVLLAVPGFLLALCVVAAFGPGTVNVAIGVGIAAVAPFARVARSEALRVVQLEYIDAARISGAGSSAILFRHVLPNSSGPIVALIPTELGETILTIAGLGFLGYGAPPPTPEWGTLLSEGRDYLANAWWLTTLPGFVVLIAVLAVSRAGRILQRRFRI
ncbi:ABC transporter permease [Mycobacterium sp. 236(2023)]|uniref:ABC transporter permease n=1 Tax=Mycobacterium sp. 236(2023) TaxID=3038163 RepID=UPI002415702A|nr:ABC transporter permease [Mycobacterium sp. 236(2023)]MDG4667635.1 ABC transporter permease [Mycobacterium sp. 236(2023)]